MNSSVCVASGLPSSHRQQLAVKIISKKWIFQLLLGLIFICHSSYRGVVELLRDLFDYPISIGTIHNRVEEVIPQAREINESEDLSSIDVALLDELFHSNRPILTGVDNESSYCFLLQEVSHRDEETWGWYLLEAREQGLKPIHSIADAGKGIRAGQKAAWPDTPCHGDVWHILDQGETLCRSLAKKLSHKFFQVKQAVELALTSTPRTSSLVENLNSRLRNYFHLRKHLGCDYLELLRFFLNHRTFMESRKPERVGKSPTELMTGEKHPHWLEMLGFELFQQA